MLCDVMTGAPECGIGGAPIGTDGIVDCGGWLNGCGTPKPLPVVVVVGGGAMVTC